MARYVPPGNPLCFAPSAVAHARGEIGTDEYIDRLLTHLGGTLHTEDIDDVEKMLFDPLSMIVQACIYQSDFHALQDTKDLRRVLLDCWNGSAEVIPGGIPSLLESLKVNGISENILRAILCIAIIRGKPTLVDYCLTLTDDPSRLIGRIEDPVRNALAGKSSEPKIWHVILENGSELSQSRYGDWGRAHLLDGLAHRSFMEGRPHTKLLQVLFQHGMVMSDTVFNNAAAQVDTETMKYLIGKCDASKMDASGALIAAAGCNGRVVGILIDHGMDVNYERPNTGPTGQDKTALHAAASAGDKDIVKLLLQRGAKRDVRDFFKRTAAESAAHKGHADVEDLITSFVS